MNVLLTFETLQNINVFIQSGIIYGFELNKHWPEHEYIEFNLSLITM